MRRFKARSTVTVPAVAAWDWHARPAALERLCPPWARIEVLERPSLIAEGARAVLLVRWGPARFRWVATHRDIREGLSFVDEQVEGPFARWLHTHAFQPVADEATKIEDRVEYKLRLGVVGDLLASRSVRRRLTRVFAWRHALTAADLDRHHPFAGRPRLRIAMAGSSGLIGSAFASFLESGGHHVVRLVRRAAARPGEIRWDPATGVVDPNTLEGMDAVVHLAGEGLAAGRWTAARKDRILQSRVRGTRTLAQSLRSLSRPPRAFVAASAVGFYGSRRDETLTEESERGRGFLSDVSVAWEEAAEEAARLGARVVRARLGVVLGAAGGALRKMLPPFLLGLGGRVGDGRQVMSWVGLNDAVGALHFLLMRDDLEGAFNVTSPRPVTQAEFAKTLGRVLGRPAVFPLPAAVVRALFGEMGEETLLASQRVLPRRLEEAGFHLRRPDLEDSLRFELGRLVRGLPEFEAE